jgi:hypothetical protein
MCHAGGGAGTSSVINVSPPLPPRLLPHHSAHVLQMCHAGGVTGSGSVTNVSRGWCCRLWRCYKRVTRGTVLRQPYTRRRMGALREILSDPAVLVELVNSVIARGTHAGTHTQYWVIKRKGGGESLRWERERVSALLLWGCRAVLCISEHFGNMQGTCRT